ncbi:MAG: hypothetical protein A2255_00370 [Candidatus Melainabacteria bacterium RIFOXYA2_FULL_32_9]|nr:MAG: hypothetical protein A2255_00370 [Candidatus Melainabacteria bacterium RIFOXYA2_FULL_32_9]
MQKKVSKRKKNYITNKERFSSLKDQKSLSKEEFFAEYINLLSDLRERERITRRISNQIREFLDLNQVLKTTVEDVGRLFNADRCLIALFNPETSKLYSENEYRISGNIPSILYTQLPLDIPHNWQKTLFIDKNSVVINDEKSNLLNTEEKQYISLFNIKSLSITPVVYKGEILGVITVQRIQSDKQWESKDIDILKDISDQIAIAIKQAELYSNIKKQAEREKLLRKIIETIRSSLDIDDVLQIICKEVAELFDVEKASIVEIKTDIPQGPQFIFKCAYKTREDILSSTDIDFDLRTHNYWKQVILDNQEILAINNLSESNTPDYFKKTYELLKVKSILGIGIKKDDDKWGGIALHKVDNYKNWTEDEISLLKVIADQIYIAIKQAELYTETKKQAEREYLLRNIISTIRNSSDIDEIKQTIVNDIGKTLNADRCIIYDIPTGIDSYNYTEYLSSQDLKSLKGVEANFITENKQEIVINDTKKYLKDHNLAETQTAKYLEEMNIKPVLSIPIIYADEVLGAFVVHFTRKKIVFSYKDLEFFRTLANQLGITLQKSRLYLTLKQIEEREKLLKKIINTIRNTPDINKSLNTICKLIAKLFNVEKVLVVDFPSRKNFKEYYIKQECKTNKHIIGISDIRINKKTIEYWENEIFVKKSKVIINNITKSDIPDQLKKTFKQIGIKSIIGLPIKKADGIWGSISLSQYNYYRNWTKEEIRLLEIIADQIYLAFLQSEMHTTIKRQIEVESLIRSDNSIVINRNLAQNIGLNCAISYSAIVKIYHYIKDEGKLDSDGYFVSTMENLTSSTYLSISEQKNALQELTDLALIKYKEDKQNKIYIRILEDENIIKNYISDPKLPHINKQGIKPKSTEKIFYNISELYSIYSKYYPKNCVNSAKYFIDKSKLTQNIESTKITKQYFAVISRTMHDFMQQYSLNFNNMRSIIDEWFSKNPSKANHQIIKFGLSNKILVNRLEKTLFYRLQEARLLITDCGSKMDFYSNTNLNLYNKIDSEKDED